MNLFIHLKKHNNLENFKFVEEGPNWPIIKVKFPDQNNKNKSLFLRPIFCGLYWSNFDSNKISYPGGIIPGFIRDNFLFFCTFFYNGPARMSVWLKTSELELMRPNGPILMGKGTLIGIKDWSPPSISGPSWSSDELICGPISCGGFPRSKNAFAGPSVDRCPSKNAIKGVSLIGGSQTIGGRFVIGILPKIENLNMGSWQDFGTKDEFSQNAIFSREVQIAKFPIHFGNLNGGNFYSWPCKKNFKNRRLKME